MRTEVIRDNDLSFAVEVLKSGELVGVPTDNVYGLAANGLDAKAVARIYEVRGHPEVEQLCLLVPNILVAATVWAGIPKSAHLLAEVFWPGPLTIVLPRRDTVPYIVTAGSHTVGVRCPDNHKILKLLRLANLPAVAPPAITSEMYSPMSAEEVLAHYDGQLHCIIDDGRCKKVAEPTVVSLTTQPYKILKQGSIPEERIQHVLGLT